MNRKLESLENSIDDIIGYFNLVIPLLNLSDVTIESVKKVPKKEETNYDLKNHLNDLYNAIRQIEDDFDDLKYDLDNTLEKISNLESQVYDWQKSFSEIAEIDFPPETYEEKEMMSLVIELYNNHSRLNSSDIDILKVLSKKTL